MSEFKDVNAIQTSNRNRTQQEAIKNQPEQLLDKTRFVARIYAPDRPIQIFNAGFVDKKYINFEEQNSRPDIRITVSPPNLAMEAIDYVKEKGLEGTPLSAIVKNMKGPTEFGFMITVDVPNSGTGLPKNQWIKSKEGMPGFEAKNYIKVLFAESGMVAESTTLSGEEVNFSLQLLRDSLEFTLKSADAEDFPFFKPKKDSDTIRSDRFIRTMGPESKMMYKYILDSLDEILTKKQK